MSSSDGYSCLTQIEREWLHELFGAEIKSFAEDRLVLIEITAHIDILRALPREHENDRRRDLRGNAKGKGFAICCRKRSNSFSRVFDDNSATMGERMPANLAGEGNVL